MWAKKYRLARSITANSSFSLDPKCKQAALAHLQFLGQAPNGKRIEPSLGGNLQSPLYDLLPSLSALCRSEVSFAVALFKKSSRSDHH
jgi:hypothetical protein